MKWTELADKTLLTAAAAAKKHATNRPGNGSGLRCSDSLIWCEVNSRGATVGSSSAAAVTTTVRQHSEIIRCDSVCFTAAVLHLHVVVSAKAKVVAAGIVNELQVHRA